MSAKAKLLGQMLIENNVINNEQLKEALQEQQKTSELLGTVLLRLGLVLRESDILENISHQIGIELISFKDFEISPDAIHKLPAKLANHYKIFPLQYSNQELLIATADPLNTRLVDDLSLMTSSKVSVVLASEKEILAAIRKYYGVGAETIEHMMKGFKEEVRLIDVEHIDTIESEATVSKFLNQMLYEAYKSRATDIHIEPFEGELKIRYRIDGVLYDATAPKNIKYFQDAIISRIKILANLNIAEKRLPQDGRFKVRVNNQDLDLRVSFLPTPYGEGAVLRILSSLKLYDLGELGFSDDELNHLGRLIKKPNGIIFVTGPTGSGKTTTLYACLAQVNQESTKIITIEDPIEYQLKNITQIQIHPTIGLSFAAGLRSMLRHDPDIMMVGEVRDFETAQIAVQVALTGHLVFSTLHTNDAASGIARLKDMKIEPYLIASTVECFIAQRLVRRICQHCKHAVELTESIGKDFGWQAKATERVLIYEGKGCEACRFTGYSGREAIYEFLILNSELKSLIINGASVSEIKERAIANGMKTLRQHGWEKVLKGITTPGEVLRVTHEDEV